MKITVRKENQNPVHTTLRVWVNGALSGTLVLRNEELDFVLGRLQPESIEEPDYSEARGQREAFEEQKYGK